NGSAVPAIVTPLAALRAIRDGAAAPTATLDVSTEAMPPPEASDTVAKWVPALTNATLTTRTPAVNPPAPGRTSVPSVEVSVAEPAYDVATLPNVSRAVIDSRSDSPA